MLRTVPSRVSFMRQVRYSTRGGIQVTCSIARQPYARGLGHILRELDRRRGFYFSSGYEYPGRYSRWDIAGVRPPVEIVARGRTISFRPLNERGVRIVRMLEPLLAPLPEFEALVWDEVSLEGILRPLPPLFPEEERSKQPSAFSVLRELIEEFRAGGDSHLALVGAFGFDLLFQFDPIELRLPREDTKDLHLFLVDEIYFMDRKKEVIERYRYDFERPGLTTEGLERTGELVPKPPRRASAPPVSDHTPEEYMANVEKVRQGARRGDFYEVVLRQTFRAPYSGRASDLFRRMQHHSPSPYEFFLQFGEEQLVGASPEMFVRIEGGQVETSPISGTIRRTGDPLEDAERIRELLNSTKDESELTMCTDVDRNDKSRVCVPGSVRVVYRRLIESYAGLFHTVDHVVGTIKPGFDALDAFLSHMWAVTVIGAPKKAAARMIENCEKDARGWYGGAIGMLMLNGDMNTGITIRTAKIRDGIVSYPVGATLLYDSEPASEQQECHVKATGFFRALADAQPSRPAARVEPVVPGEGPPVRMLLIDNADCFIHTLANYAQQTGAQVMTYRAGFPPGLVEKLDPDLILISPGPGRPADFGVPGLVRHAAGLGIPVFGVCLGLQGTVEAFGGELGVLDYPMHGKPSEITHGGVGVFEGLPERLQVGRYHSLYAIREKLPPCLEVTAETFDGVIMGVRHKELPVEAVQFHPESILSSSGDHGLAMMANMVRLYGRARVRPTA